MLRVRSPSSRTRAVPIFTVTVQVFWGVSVCVCKNPASLLGRDFFRPEIHHQTLAAKCNVLRYTARGAVAFRRGAGVNRRVTRRRDLLECLHEPSIPRPACPAG